MQTKSIIVIEDNKDFATILETVLRMWGYAVEVYDTLATGAAAVGRSSASMLILDGQLPDGEGYTLYQRLRQQPATQRLPILLLSVSDEVHELARSARSTDPHLFVGLKPMPLDEIQAIVERVVPT